MKIEVGKRYLTQEGNIAFIVKKGIGFCAYSFVIAGDSAIHHMSDDCDFLKKCLDDETLITADDVGKRVILSDGDEDVIESFDPYDKREAVILKGRRGGFSQKGIDSQNFPNIVEILEDEPEEERKDFKVKTTKEELEKILELLKNSELKWQDYYAMQKLKFNSVLRLRYKI